jgi:hypothetical protein
MTNKSHAVIELFDNGIGMNEQDLEKKYVIIGRNRRLGNPQDKAAGRKGIGKLAALYLSDNYCILSKQSDETTSWMVDVTNMDDESTPSLESVDLAKVEIVCSDLWNSKTFKYGTLIQLRDVNLTRLGDAAIEALKHKLSNYFLFDTMNNNLYLCIKSKSNEEMKFERLIKQIAFDNMSSIYCSTDTTLATTTNNFEVSFTNKLGGDCTFLDKRQIMSFPSKVKNQMREEISLTGEATFYGKICKYELTGWIGIHATIEKEQALKNDNRYIKNQFYNPNEIRVYVRNKLANNNILDKLGLVAQYANYIEGEISFEILDVNDLEDIATSNRQEFSRADERVKLLLDLLRGICVKLIADRQDLANKLNVKKKDVDNEIRTKEKTNFTRELREDLITAQIPEESANNLALVISNKLKGSFELKTAYKLFISHSTKDRIFTDFISHYLQHRGFKCTDDPDTTDIFYSSDGLNITNLDPLSDIIKKMILDANTDILFFTSKNFLESQYCLFEGGAVWATRAVLEYSIISIDYKCIPAFLTNGKVEFTFDSSQKTSFTLNEQNYKNLTLILNRAINHLNNNKQNNGEPTVTLIPISVFPDEVQRKIEGKKLEDYMDAEVLLYWKTYVLDKIDDYLKVSP